MNIMRNERVVMQLNGHIYAAGNSLKAALKLCDRQGISEAEHRAFLHAFSSWARLGEVLRSRRPRLRVVNGGG